MGPVEAGLLSLGDVMREGRYDPKGGKPVPIEDINAASTISRATMVAILDEWAIAAARRGVRDAAREVGAESEELAELMTRSGVPKRFAGCSVDRTQEHVLAQGRWVYVCSGDVGRATTKACGLAKAWLADNRRGRFVFVRSPTMLTAIRDDDSGATSFYASRDLLLVSGLGAENVTDWTVSKVWEVLDRRSGAGLPTIVTTRHQPNELAAHYGSPDVMQVLMDRSVLVEV